MKKINLLLVLALVIQLVTTVFVHAQPTDSLEILATEYDRASENVQTDENGIRLNAGEWLEFDISADSEQIYTLNAVAACDDDGAEVELYINGNLKSRTAISCSGSDSRFLYNFLTNLALLTDITTIKIKLVQGNGIILRKLSFEDYALDNVYKSGTSVKVEAENYRFGEYYDKEPGLDSGANVDRSDEGYDTDVDIIQSGTGLVLVAWNTEWWNYDLDVPESGNYDVYANVASSMAINMKFTLNESISKNFTSLPTTPVDGKDSWSSYERQNIGSIDLNAGNNILKIAILNNALHLDYIEFVKKPAKPEFYALYSDNTPLFGSNKAKRGAESLCAYFTDELDSASPVTAKLYNGEKSIPAVCKINKNTLQMELFGTFDYETEYSLDISGIRNVSGGTFNTIAPIKFTTCAESEDDGNGSFKEISAHFDGNMFVSEGVVINGAENAVSGRGVYAILKNGEQYTTEKAYSSDGGAFRLEYTLPEEANEGTYAITVYTDYAGRRERKNFNIPYVSEQTKNIMFGALEDATDYTEVQTAFEENRDKFGIKATDLNGLDNEKFYRHFVGAHYTEISEFLADYNKFLVFEKVNQETSIPKMRLLIRERTNCEILGIDYLKIKLIDLNIDALCGDIIASEDTADVSKFADSVNAMLDAYLIDEYNIAEPVLLLEGSQSYVGKQTDISVGLEKNTAELVGAEYTISCPNAEIAKSVVVRTENGTSQSSISDKIVTIKTKSDNSDKIPQVYAQIVFGDVGNYDFIVSGKAEYKVADEVTCYADITAGNVSIDIKKNNDNTPPPTGGGGGSNSGGFKPVIIDKPVPTPKPSEEPTDYSFDDLDSAVWAEENVKNLLNKGVISRSENRKFRPSDHVKREEFVKMVVLAFGLYDENAVSEFSDVETDVWYASYVASAKNKGIIFGREDGTFGTGDAITRQEMAVMLYRAVLDLGISEKTNTNIRFTDDGEISDYAKDAVYALCSMGIINGIGNDRFAPNDTATRAMAARMIDLMMSGVEK